MLDVDTSITKDPAGTLSKRSVDSNISKASKTSSSKNNGEPGPIASALATAIAKGVAGPS